MKEKLLELLRSEGLKAGQFAEMLGISQGVVSHFLGGRNKPSFDVLQKILKRFPRINPDWLLLDSPQMYRTLPDTSGASDTPGIPGAPGANIGASARSAAPLGAAQAADLFTTAGGTSGNSQTPPAKAAVPQPGSPATPSIPAGSGRRVARVVLCYEDGTFESYAPTAE